MMSRQIRPLSVAVLTAIIALCFSASAVEENSEPESPWYVFHGSTSNHPNLKASDRDVEKQINRPFRLMAPGFDDVKTFTDQADNFMIWTPFVGVGRRFGKHWDLFFQVGASAGQVRTKDDDVSLALLPLHTDVVIKRSSIFVGPGLSWYPFGFSENSPGMSWSERLAETRPFIFATVNYNRLTVEADVKAGLKPFGNFIHKKQDDSWHPFSSAVGAGVDVPLTRRTTLALNAQYVFFYDYAGDFNGPTYAIFFKHSLGSKR